jgi:hypothetical protein
MTDCLQKVSVVRKKKHKANSNVLLTALLFVQNEKNKCCAYEKTAPLCLFYIKKNKQTRSHLFAAKK